MLVWDTGASIGLTPFCSDFIDYLPLDGMTVKDIAQENTLLGIGTVMWKFKSWQGNDVFIPAIAYYMPECDICIQSPQSYFQLHSGHSKVSDNKVTMYLPGLEKHIVDIPIDETCNLPVIMEPQITHDEQLNFGPHIFSAIVANTLNIQDIYYKPLCCKTVTNDSNQNLTGPQTSTTIMLKS